MEVNALWRRVICVVHNSNIKLAALLAKKSLPRVWHKIMSVVPNLGGIGLELSSIFNIEIGSSERTLFWFDDWVGGGPLKSRFPRLFELDKKKYCYISEIFVGNAISWAWMRFPKCSMEILELGSIFGIVNSISILG